MRKFIVLIGLMGAAVPAYAQELEGDLNAWWIFGGLVLAIAVGSVAWSFIAARGNGGQPNNKGFERRLGGPPDFNDPERERMMGDSPVRPSRPARPGAPAQQQQQQQAMPPGEKSLEQLQAELNDLNAELAKLQAESRGDGIIPDPQTRRVITRMRTVTDEIKRRSPEDQPTEDIREQARRRRSQNRPSTGESSGDGLLGREIPSLYGKQQRDSDQTDRADLDDEKKSAPKEKPTPKPTDMETRTGGGGVSLDDLREKAEEGWTKSREEEGEAIPDMDYMEEAPAPLEEEDVITSGDAEPEPAEPEQEEEITFGDAAPPPSPSPAPPAPPPAPPAPAPMPAPADQSPLEPDVRTAEFTAYYPREAPAEHRSGLYVYAQATEDDIRAQVQADVEKYKEELGGEVPKPKTAKQTANLPLGTRITVMPECDEIEFEPPTITKRWRGKWTRFGFEFWPDADLMDETVFVRISVQVEGIEIAHIKAAMEIVEGREDEPEATLAPEITPADLPENPLLAHKLTAQSITPYQRIFISYSRRDGHVARSYKIAQTALGNDCFLDVDNLRSGEDWQAGLARAIDEADVFQLFWSEHSAASKYCRYEWEYALDQRCGDASCEGFIRPEIGRAHV